MEKKPSKEQTTNKLKPSKSIEKNKVNKSELETKESKKPRKRIVSFKKNDKEN